MTVPLVTRVLVADDHPIVRRGLRELLDPEPDFKVVAETADGADAVRRRSRTTSTWRSSTSRCRALPGSRRRASWARAAPT